MQNIINEIEDIYQFIDKMYRVDICSQTKVRELSRLWEKIDSLLSLVRSRSRNLLSDIDEPRPQVIDHPWKDSINYINNLYVDKLDVFLQKIYERFGALPLKISNGYDNKLEFSLLNHYWIVDLEPLPWPGIHVVSYKKLENNSESQRRFYNWYDFSEYLDKSLQESRIWDEK
jgi:hypothetical protein